MKWPTVRQGRAAIETISHIAVIVAVPLFFVQLREDDRLRRAEASMAFIRLASEQEYPELVARLSEPWENVDVAAFMAGRPSPAGIAQFKLAATDKVRDRDIEKLAEFYQAVLICRTEGYCEKELLDAFYRPGIAGFYCSYDIRLNRIGQRLNRPDYMRALADYAGPC